MRKNEDIWRCTGYDPHDDRFERIEAHHAPGAAFASLKSSRCRDCERARVRIKRQIEQWTPPGQPQRCSGFVMPDGTPGRAPHDATNDQFSPLSKRCRECDASRLRVKRAWIKTGGAPAPLTIRQEPSPRPRAAPNPPPPPVPIATGIFPPGFVRPLDRLRARRLAERIAAGEIIELREA